MENQRLVYELELSIGFSDLHPYKIIKNCVLSKTVHIVSDLSLKQALMYNGYKMIFRDLLLGIGL